MATDLLQQPDTDGDDLNPGQEHADDLFPEIDYGQDADPTQEDENIAKTRDKLRDSEENPKPSSEAPDPKTPEGKQAAKKNKDKDKEKSDEESEDDDDDKGPKKGKDESEGKRKVRRDVRKKWGAASVLAGGGIIGTLLIFSALLPLKTESMVNIIKGRFGAAADAAIEKETSGLFSGYIKEVVLDELGKPGCHSTIDAGCVHHGHLSGPIGKLYATWKNNKFEQVLAKKYELSIGVSGNTYYINNGGKKLDMGNKEEFIKALDDPDTTHGKLHEIEAVISQRLKEGTLWDKVYYRFRVAPFLREKYGIRFCVNACRPLNKFSDNIKTKKTAAKSYVIQRVITPLSENYALILQCVIEGGSVCSTVPEDAPDGSPDGDTSEAGTNRDSPATKELQDRLRKYAEELAAREGTKTASEILEQISKSAEEIGKKGIKRVIVGEVTKKASSVLFGGATSDALGEIADKAVNPIAIVLTVAEILHGADEIGPAIKYLGYAASAAAAAALWNTYQTVGSETKSGQIDATQLGSFNDALSTNLDQSAVSAVNGKADLTAANSDYKSDATQTPLYNAYFGGGSSSSGAKSAFLGGSLSGTASALTNDPGGGYTCPTTGKPVPKGKLVCDDEDFTRGNETANSISASVEKGFSIIPGSKALIDAIAAVKHFENSVLNYTLGKIVEVTCLGPCQDGLQKIAGLIGQLMGVLIDKLIVSPLATLSGGRIFDMLVAGAQVSFNSACQLVLGCKVVSPQVAADIQTNYLQQQQKEFDKRSLFARMFSTDTPYSMVSRLALATPGSASMMASNTLFSLQQSPLGRLGNVFSSLLVPHNAFAATAATASPFGIPSTAYTEVPSNPQSFWDNNCVNGPMGWWTEDAPAGQQLDISKWVNQKDGDGNPVNVRQNENTGQTDYINDNPCLLILSSVQSAGGAMNPDLLPADSLNSDSGSTAGSSSNPTNIRIASFNVLGANHTGSYTARADKSLAVITSKHLDIVGMQEFQGVQRTYFMKRLTNYSVFPKMGVKDTHHSTENSIIWDNTRFTQVGEGGSQPNLHYFCTADNPDTPSELYAPYVKLEDKVTHQQFYVLNTHDPANSDNNHCPTEVTRHVRYLNALEHEKFVKKLQGEGLPVYYTGDFNSSYEMKSASKAAAHPNGTPYQDKAENLTYCVLTKKGNGVMDDAYDVFSKRAVTCDNNNPPGSGGGIDHVYTTEPVTVSAYDHVDSGVNGSDHPTMIFDTQIPGSGGAGSQFRIASYNVRVHTTSAQNQVVVSNIKSNHFGIVGMQELSYPDIFSSFKSKLQSINYGIWPEQYTDTWGANGTAITWDNAQFSRVKTDEIQYPAGDKATTDRIGAPTKSPIVWLQDKTGQQMIVMNVHYFAFGSAYGGGQIRSDASKIVTAKIKQLAAEGLPILLVGDFNQGYGPLGTTYCMLETQHLMTSPFVKNPSDYCTADGKTGPIDHILISSGVTGTTGNLTSKFDQSNEANGVFSDLGTDHNNIPYSDITIPGQSSGTPSDPGGGGGSSGVPTLSSVRNFRDAAALTGTLKTGKLLRSGSLNDISTADAGKLSSYLGNTGTIVNFWPDANDSRVSGVQKVDYSMPGTTDYTEFVEKPKDRTQFAKAITLIANANGPVLVHCQGGRDRTGWLVAMVMQELGATQNQILNEYLASNGQGVGVVTQHLLNVGLDDARARHGSFAKYITDGNNSNANGGLGVSQATLTKLKQKLDPGS
jgi:exonuclease III